MNTKIIAVAVVLLSFSVESFTYTLKVKQDVTLRFGAQNLNYLQFLRVGNLETRSLIRFRMPSGCGVVSYATMYLYYFAPTLTQSSVRAYRVLQSWEETEATFIRRDSSNIWGTAGLGLDDIDAEILPTGAATIINGQPSGFIGIDVKSAVEHWVNGADNFGLVILASNDVKIRFASESHSDSSKHPYIDLQCT